MSSLEEKRAEIYNELVSAPTNIILSRQKIVDEIYIATGARDSNIGTPFKTDDMPYVAEQLGKIKTLLKGASISELLKHNFNRSSVYAVDPTFTIPSVTTFGYLLLDSNSNEIVLSATPGDPNYFGNFYFSKDKTGTFGTMVSSDTNPIAFTSPQLSSEALETLDDDFGTEKLYIKKVLNQTPELKETPISSMKVFIDTKVIPIGLIDEFGNVTNTNGFDYLDENNSFMDYTINEIDLRFLTEPISTTLTASLEYEYNNSSNSVTDNFNDAPSGTFDSGTFIFTKRLSATPIVDTITVFNKNSKIAITNKEGKIFSMLVDTTLSKFRIKDNEIDIKISNITEERLASLKFEYTDKNIVKVKEVIGSLNETSKVITDSLSNTNPVDITSIRILLGGTEVATSDTAGVITGTYTTIDPVENGTITGTVNEAGNVSLTFIGDSSTLIYTPVLNGLTIQYKTVIGLTNWLVNYDQLDVNSVGTVAYTGGTLNTITLAASSLDNAPLLLNTYPLKRHTNEQVYGNLIVVSEGLEVNPDWVPAYIKRDASSTGAVLTSAAVGTSAFSTDVLVGFNIIKSDVSYPITANTGSTITATGLPDDTGPFKFEILASATDTTKIIDTDFALLFGWLDPANEPNDDMLKTANPNNISSGAPDELDDYPDLKNSPLFPATNGTHADRQPGSLLETDIFAGNYGHFQIENGRSTIKWAIHSDKRWEYDPAPNNGVLVPGINIVEEQPIKLKYNNLTGLSSSVSDLSIHNVNVALSGTTVAVSGSVSEIRGTHNPLSGTSTVISSSSSNLSSGYFRTYQDIFIPNLSIVETFTSANPTSIPNDGSGGPFKSDYTVYRIENNLIREIVLTYNDEDEQYEEKTNILYPCYYNDVYNTIIQPGTLSYIIEQESRLSTFQDTFPLGGVNGFQDTITTGAGGAPDDLTFWTALDAYEGKAQTFFEYHNGYVLSWSGGNPNGTANDYDSTKLETDLQPFITTFSAAVTAEITSIDNRIGTAIATGSTASYARDLYDFTNPADDRNISFVANPLNKYYNLSGAYARIDDLRIQYRFYDKAIEGS